MVQKLGLNGVIIGTVASNLVVILFLKPILTFIRCFDRTAMDYLRDFSKKLALTGVATVICGGIFTKLSRFINKEIVVRARPEYDETYVYLDNLAVKNEYQDKKIGTNLLEVIIKEFKKVSEKYNCISGMILAPKITELEKFYEKFEFTLFKDYKLDDIKHFGLKF